MYRQFLLFAVLVSIVLVGCAAGGSRRSGTDGIDPIPSVDGSTPTDSTSPPQPPPPAPRCPAGESTKVRGTVTFPNGTLPVSKAFVYIQGTVAPARTGECGECIARSGLLVYAETGPDGRFELNNVPEGSQVLIVEKGKFRKEVSIEVTECETASIEADDTRLPRDSSEGDIPRIAVLTGLYDHMESVLIKLGLAPGSFDLYDDGLGNSSRPDPRPMLRDRERLASYDIVFVNCGSMLGEPLWDPISEDPSVRFNLDDYVKGGGRLYVTDLSYDLLEGPMPRFVDFYGSPGEGLSSVAEIGGDAEVGGTVESLAATVHDDGLRAWLDATGALLDNGLMEVKGLLGGWTMIDRVDKMRTKTWVSGDVTSPDHPGGVRPLTVTFENGCGRALFSSYHTLEEEESLAGLSAQEQSLAYLVLEVGTCIEEPVLF